ncbi:hypothetical protein Tco_0661163 [Tanacetum coccineum]
MHSPLQSHMKAALRVLRYLKGSPGLGLASKRYTVKCSVDIHRGDLLWSLGFLDRSCTREGCSLILLVMLQSHNVSTLYPVELHYDNSSGIQLAANPMFHEKSKHFEIDVHFVREKVSAGIIKTIKIHTDLQVADIFTKCLGVVQHVLSCLEKIQRSRTKPEHSAIQALVQIKERVPLHLRLSAGDSNVTHHYGLCELMGGSGPLSSPRFTSKGEELGSTSIGVPIVSYTSFRLKVKGIFPYKRWAGGIVRTYLTQSCFGGNEFGQDNEAFTPKDSNDLILASDSDSLGHLHEFIANDIHVFFKLMNFLFLITDETRNKSFELFLMGWLRFLFHVGGLNGVSVALVARFGVISQGTSWIFAFHGG